MLSLSKTKAVPAGNICFYRFKEALIKSTCADLRRKFSLTRKKSAEILCVFQAFLTKFSGDFRREDARGDLCGGSLGNL